MGWTTDFSQLLVSGGHVISQFAPWLAMVLAMLILPIMAGLYWTWRHGRSSGSSSPDPAGGGVVSVGRVSVGAGAVGTMAAGATAVSSKRARKGPTSSTVVSSAGEGGDGGSPGRPDYSDQWRKWHNDPYQIGDRPERLAEVVPLRGPQTERKVA